MKVLVIQLRRIGDILMATPALEALRRRHPEASIDVLAERPGDQVLEGNPDVDRVLVYEPERPLAWLGRVRAERYDWVVDFLGNPRSALLTFASGAALRAGPAQVFHRWAYNRRLPESPVPLYSAEEKLFKLKGLDIPWPPSVLPKIVLEESRLEWARGQAEGLGAAGRLLAICPASRRATRQWPAERFAALARLAAQRLGLVPVVFWGPGERPLAEAVAAAAPGARLAPETRHLKDLAALLKTAAVVVTNCNGPRHLAVAVGTPTLALHFSSDPRVWNPPSDPRFPYLRKEDLFCIGCRLNECPYRLECMTGLAPEDVFARLERLVREVVS